MFTQPRLLGITYSSVAHFVFAPVANHQGFS